MTAPTLVVMAAGAGSRFGGPKQTTPVGPNGEWLLEFAIFDAIRAGFGRVVFVIRDELSSDFRGLYDRIGDVIEPHHVVQHLGDIPSGAPPLSRTRPWGTGHAVLSVRNLVSTPFAIMNADDFYGPDAYTRGAEACAAAAASGRSTVVAMRLDRTLSPHGPVKRGWCQAAGGRVTRIEEVMGIERKDGRLQGSERHAGVDFTGEELVSMNFWVFPPSIFGQLSAKFDAFLRRHGQSADAEFLLPEVVNELIEEGAMDLRVEEAPGPWFGLTYLEDREGVEAGLRDLTGKRVYPAPLWSRTAAGGRA